MTISGTTLSTAGGGEDSSSGLSAHPITKTATTKTATTTAANNNSSNNRDEEEKQQEDDENTTEATNDKILAFWKQAKDDGGTTPDLLDKAFDDTMGAVSNQIEALIRSGLEAFHRWENTARELKLLQDETAGKEIEFERLRLAEEKSRETVSQLLQALETSRTEARENARAAVAEAGLRAELSYMTSQRDQATNQAEGAKRKVSLLQEEVRQVKTKLSRVTQEKLKMERDQRATMSLARSLDSSNSTSGGGGSHAMGGSMLLTTMGVGGGNSASDVEYYKRKAAELSSQVQSNNAVIAEKNRQIEEMRYQIERNLSQNRLANLRRDMGRDMTSGSSSSRKRLRK